MIDGVFNIHAAIIREQEMCLTTAPHLQWLWWVVAHGRSLAI